MGIKAITDDMWRANGLHMSKSNVTIALVMIVGINVSLIFSFLDENLQHLQLWNQSENSYEETRERGKAIVGSVFHNRKGRGLLSPIIHAG